MSRIDALIEQHCPKGVPFVPIGEVTTRPSNIRWTNRTSETFQYIDLASVDRVTHKIAGTTAISSDTAPSRAQRIVRVGDVVFATTRPTQMRWTAIPAEFDGQIASTGYCVMRPDQSRVLTNYLGHMMGTDSFRRYIEVNEVPGNYPSIPDSRLREFRIPLPPIKVQREIVKVLDTFAELEAELETGLVAELEARKVQYAHYRETLLTFTERERWVRLSEVGTFRRGRRFVKADVVEEGVPSIHYGEIYTDYGVSAVAARSQVRGEIAGSLRFARTGEVLIAGVGETVEDVGKAVAWLGQEQIAFHDDCFAFKHEMNPTFVAYAMQTANFHAQKARFVSRGKLKRLSADGLGQVVIPVPSRSEQDRIVAVLDGFDGLVNDLSLRLPAELRARRRQYEYYRDRLLMFPEAL